MRGGLSVAPRGTSPTTGVEAEAESEVADDAVAMSAGGSRSSAEVAPWLALALPPLALPTPLLGDPADEGAPPQLGDAVSRPLSARYRRTCAMFKCQLSGGHNFSWLLAMRGLQASCGDRDLMTCYRLRL